MTSRVQTNRFTTTGSRPPSTRPVGEVYFNFAENQLGVVADVAPVVRDLLPLRIHTPSAQYVAGALIANAGRLYRAKAAIAPKAFAYADWLGIGSDELNVCDFGARLDGVTNDNAAYAAARAAAPVNGSIVVPSGRHLLTVAPTTGPSGSVLWKYDGNLVGTGSNYVTGTGTDIIENFIGSKYWARAHSYAACPPILRADLTIDHAGGSASNVLSGQQVNVTTSATSTAAEAVVGIGAVLTTHADTGGNNVALIGYSTRASDAGRVPMTGANIYAKDQTGGTSGVHGSLNAVEFNIVANNLDDGGAGAFYAPDGEGIRVGVLVTCAKEIAGGADLEVGWGVNVTSHPGVTYRRMFSALGPFSKNAFSTEFAIQNPGANAIQLADGHRIALDTAGTRTLSYDSASGKLFFAVSGVNKFSIDANGNMRSAGTVTGSVTP